MKINLFNKDYIFLKRYQKESGYRSSFNSLVNKTFGFSFEEWYQAGYWNEKYILYTLFDTEKAIANVSINIMDFIVFGKKQRYIQIGTVMTDEEYRNKNLSRFLMEKILEEWSDKCHFIYLYANNSVLNFYPKFGFENVKEFEYYKSIKKQSTIQTYEKLNMNIQANRNKLYIYAKNSRSFGKLSMQENADLVMFYSVYFLKNNVYYISILDLIVIAKFNKNQLHIFDIFGEADVELEAVIYSFINSEINQVILGFTPEDYSSYQVRQVLGDDTLFIQKGKTTLFEQNKIIFPLLSHA